MDILKNLGVLIARILVCVWFLPAGIEKIVNYEATAGYMVANHVFPQLLPLVIATEIACAVMLLLGWKTHLFAFLLAGYTLLAVLLFHVPAADPVDKIIQMSELVNAGLLLVLAAHGAGDWSVDARKRPKRTFF